MPTTPLPLNRLTTQAQTLAAELKLMPDADSLQQPAFTQALQAGRGDTALALLKDAIDQYWNVLGAQDLPRRWMFITAMKQGLRDEVALKIQDGSLVDGAARYVPAAAPTQGQASDIHFHALSLRFNELTSVELSGVLLLTLDADNAGPLLLWIPGHGVEGFASRELMLKAITDAVNHSVLRDPLAKTMGLEYQDLLLDIENDPDLTLEPFETHHWQLLPVSGDGIEHAFTRQLRKQQDDLAYAFGEGRRRSADPDQQRHRINQAARMPQLFGPAAMLALRAARLDERAQRQTLPEWFKAASAQDRQRYLLRLQHYDQSRAVLNSLLGGAGSLEQFVHLRLRSRLETDLGYDLDPEQLFVTTRRTLMLTGETYEVRRSLTQLALYGLHPGDAQAGSDFLRHTRFSLEGEPLSSVYPRLTATYLASLIDQLDLRSQFGAYQRQTYGTSGMTQRMAEPLLQRLIAQAHAAKLQWHIGDGKEGRPDDLPLFEALDPSNPNPFGKQLQLQQLQLNERDTLNNVLVLRKNDALGQLERLVLFSADIPRERCFQSFDNERQLLQEVVGWSASPELTHYLLAQVLPARRPELQKQLLALREKAQPPANFITYLTHPSVADALHALVGTHIRVQLAEQAVHTPDWYLRASPVRRQELVALEDALEGATRNYREHAHTHVQDFDAYVHERAQEKINALLGNPQEPVDPDHIIITSPRETLSYTHMLRNGYDDGLGFLNPGAATQARFSGPEGVNLAPLSAEKVAGSVRGDWPSDTYVALIKSTLLNPDNPGYHYRRIASLLITQLQMKAAALRSRLKEQINEQQYLWLQRSIERMHLRDVSSRRDYPVYPLQFELHNPLIATDLPALGEALDFLTEVGSNALQVPKPVRIETVQGCYLLTPGSGTDTTQAMLYTPQAPDGLEFRALSNFLNTLHAEGMSDYYKDRCRISANRTLAFFLIDMKKGGNSQPPTLPAAPYADLFTICYNRMLERKLLNVEETTTGRADMLKQLVWNSIELIATAVTLPFPPASFAVGALLALRDSFKALEAFSEGDREAAAGYILASLLNTLGAYGDLDSGLKGFGGILKQSTRSQEPNRALQAVKKLQRQQPMDDLQPLSVQGETFHVDTSARSRYLPLFRGSAEEPHTLVATGQFAERNADGGLQPVSLGASPALPTPGTPAFHTRAVNISLKDLEPITSGHATGTKRLNGKHYIELDSRVFEVQYDAKMRFWNIIDPANPYAFFGKQPVRHNAQGQWEVATPMQLRGGMDGRFQLLEEPTAGPSTPVAALSDYEMPGDWKEHMLPIVDPAYRPDFFDALGLESVQKAYDDIYTDGHSKYMELRQNLYRDAKAYFDNVSLAAKPDLPVLGEAADADTLIKAVFENTNGLVISEASGSIASKQLLIDNMPRFAEQDVEILYIEHLFTDQHLPKLRKYQTLGSKSTAGSDEIKNHLNAVNRGALNNSSEKYDYYHVIKAAHRHNIEVRPFNSSVSYDFANNPVPAAASDDLAAKKMSLFFGNKIVSADIAAKPVRRWIALLDHKLANTYEHLPGLCELHGVISVRAEDVARSQPLRISRDLPQSSHSHDIARGDFKIEMPNPLIKEPTTAPIATRVEPSSLDHQLHTYLDDAPLVGSNLTNPYIGEHGFQLNAAGRWQRVEASNWVADQAPTAIQQSLADPLHEIPVQFRGRVHDLSNFQHRGLHRDYHFAEPALREARGVFFDSRRTLQRDARALLSTELPPRVAFPQVPEGSSSSAFLDLLYENTSGVVIGEAHSSVASKKLIIDNLPHLSGQNVKTLYMEHLLTDIHQADLDRFFDTGQMSKTLLHDLKLLDKGHHTDPQKIYTFENLVLKAKENGVEIRAIDCAASYHLKGLTTSSATTRQQMMNYYASRTIRRHQETLGEHKWIALVGNTHANTFQQVPGIAELEKGIGVRVIDVAPGQGKAPVLDPGEHVTAKLPREHTFLKNDFRLEMETPNIGVIPPPMPERPRLILPGMFEIDESIPDRPVIHHRSRSGTVQTTPILINAESKLYIDRPSWQAVHRQPYENLNALIRALEAMNMTRVS